MDVETNTDSADKRGVKRKADDESPTITNVTKRIKALDQNVINKIAAGEIIVAPMHALKEMIENAVDAGATSIEVVIKDGGLKLLQITDNGHGIHRDDLSILCERFTTSKLKSFEDLGSIATYGFRGEALASISHIAHLAITTRTVDSSCAWRAHYLDGKLVPAKPGQSADPRPIAGRGGTQITVEDLFYNIPQRRKAFKSFSEEYAKILDIVGRYAVHCDGVAFSCKKHGEPSMGIAVSINTNTNDKIRQIYGTSVANELVPFSLENQVLGFKAAGLVTNANYSVKKTTMLLFINHRSVESSPIRLAMQRTYAAFLPKGGHPFIYLSIDIDPQRVDVNVHPTKREVNFLNEDEIVEAICETVRSKLADIDTSRTFLTQALLRTTGHDITPPDTAERGTISSAKSNHRPAGHNLVRTDPLLRKITSMLPPANSHDAARSDVGYSLAEKPHMQIRLSSVKELRASVKEAMHGVLTEMFSALTYVGLVDAARRLVAIQSGVKLYLVDYAMVCNEFFYQLGLTDFGNFGTIELGTPIDIKSLVAIAANIEEQKSLNRLDLSNAPSRVTNRLIQHREMLLEYFSIEITEDGCLKSLPLLLKGYTPPLAKLPSFLLRLGPCVDWIHEKECFRTLLTELASFYTPVPFPNDESEALPESESAELTGVMPTLNGDDGEREQLSWTLEHVLFPAFKARLVATKGLLRGVIEVANLKGLYRVFERC